METEKMKNQTDWNVGTVLGTALVLIFIIIILVPVWMLISGSFMGETEVNQRIGAIFANNGRKVEWPIIPQYPTLKPYIELLLDSPNFFIMFWNSVGQVGFIIFGQIIIAVPGAWSFGKFNFKGKKILFLMYTLLMILPFQVTMVSSYLVLDKMNLMNTHLAIILPGIFSTFPVFIMVKFFEAIPKSLFEAAQLDGANEWQIFIKIGVPLGNAGIMSAVVLQFLEYWNAIEQPLTFLGKKGLWPLSLYLPNISADKMGVSLAASVIMLIPALFIFLYGQNYLEQGICSMGIKE